ncbi:MAG: hypothetical protein GSR74_01030 [Desulfurococcales archaeon]|nr:hypothetical protein [Desulfurococcales archaeon]
MSMGVMSRVYRDSRIRVKEREKIIKLVKIYSNDENIRDEGKAVALLIYTGYQAWVTGKAGDKKDDLLVKYYTLTQDLLGLSRELLILIRELERLITDKKAKDKIQKYLKQVQQRVDTAIIEASFLNKQ